MDTRPIIATLYAHAIHLHAVALVGPAAGPTPAAGTDPVSAKLQQYAGWASGWNVYIMIIGLVLALGASVIGSRQGWTHLRELVVGGVIVSILIGAAPTLF